MRTDRFNWGVFCRHMLTIREATEDVSVFEQVACPRSLQSEAERLIRFLGIEDNVALMIGESHRRKVRPSIAHRGT